MRPALVMLAVLVALAMTEGRFHLEKGLPPSLHLSPGDNLSLSCTFKKDPRSAAPSKKLRIRWFRNDEPLTKTSDRYRITRRNSTEKGTFESTLELTSLTLEDKGNYTCSTSDGRNKDSQSTCMLNVTRIHPTEITFETLSPGDFNSTSPIDFFDLSPTINYEFNFTDMNNLSTRFESNFQPKHPFTINISKNAVYPTEEPPILCQKYTGAICARFFENVHVFIPYQLTQASLEERLTQAFGVVSYSKEITQSCSNYALPSLCYSTFPVCRTPEFTNEDFTRAYNRKKELEDKNSEETKITFENGPGKLSQTDFVRFIDNKRRERSVDFLDSFQINEELQRFNDRNNIPLRRVCKDDCEILETEICQAEYAIAKRHPEIGKKLTLEDCVDLPDDSTDCLEIGIEKFFGTDDRCYWESGVDYAGKENHSYSGLPCIKWKNQIRVKIANHHELSGGHNYCRNPGGAELQPWCFVDKENKIDKEPCDIPKCSHKIWIYIIVAIIIFLAILFACVYICCRYQNVKNNTTAIRNINLPNADKNIYGNSRLNSPIELTDMLHNGLGNSSNSRTNKIITVPQYSITQIKFLEELGEGAFGKVYKGKLLRENDGALVAVKTLKENASHKMQMDFKREIELISELNHQNIVCILGVVLRDEPLCMLFEFMALGDLHEFLVGKAPPSGSLMPPQLLAISHHIACGMEYLAAHHYVHRDLAARNCLVAENLTVKISDFGLSRDIYSSDYYRVQSKSLLPIRWMPPESILYGKFTSESDVWSYGVVLWEIYSYGLQPYYGYSNQEVISMVRGRELLKCPADCPRAIYNLMKECWNQTPARRPNFTIISERLSDWINSSVGMHMDNSSESSGAHSSQRAPMVCGDPRERVPLISHHSSSNGSLTNSIPRKLSTAGSVKSHASTRLMVSSSDVTSGSDNCDINVKKLSCGSLIDGQVNERRDGKKTAHPYAI